jgi:hypothetical protein
MALTETIKGAEKLRKLGLKKSPYFLGGDFGRPTFPLIPAVSRTLSN